MANVLIGTSGFSYDSWYEPGVFYPPEVNSVKEQLRYYISKFDMLTISNTYDSNPDSSLYEEWADIVISEKKPFSFVVTAPKKFTDSHSIESSIKVWNMFWNGYVGVRNCTEHVKKGGCKILHERGVLACILLKFPSSFHYSLSHVNKILKITRLVPKDIRLSFLFFHCSWRESRQKILELFQERTNWCICTPFVENRIANFGWAGNISSTRTLDSCNRNPPILLTTDFVHITLSGTLGPYLGSYDKNGFLEKFVEEMNKLRSIGVKNVYCSFDATALGTTFCYPLPRMIISGFFLNPKIDELPSHTSVDRPCCLHDAFRLQDLLKLRPIEPELTLGLQDASKYKKDEEGFLDIKFK